MGLRPAQTTALARRIEGYTYRASILLALLAALAVLVYMAVAWHARLIFAEHPQDLRENATYLSTVLLLRGQNPWTLENQPQYANLYGALFNLVALPAAAVFGCTFALHRLLCALFLLLCSVIIFLVLRRYRTPVLLAIAAPIILYQQYMPTFASNAKPDNLGLFLFLCALFYPWWRRFSTASLCVATGLSLLALCAKTYFAVGLLYLAVYLFFFEGKAKAVIYLVLSAVAVRLLGALVDLVAELYWPEVYFMQLNGTWPEFPFLVDQLSWYVRKNFGLLSALGLLLIVYLYTRVRGRPAPDSTAAPSPRARVFSAARDLRAPLLLARMDFVTFVLVFSTVLILVRVGWRPGNFGVYFHQLVTPFLLIVVFRAIPSARLPRAILVALPCVQLLVAQAGFRPLRPSSMQPWQEWEALFAGHRDVFAGAVFAHILDKQGKAIYDDGQTEYVPLALRGPPKPTVRKIRARLTEYERDVRDKLARQAFTLIVQKHDYYHHSVTPELLAQHYELVEQRNSRSAMTGGAYDIWLPARAPPTSIETLPRDGLALWLCAGTGVTADADGRVLAWSEQSGQARAARAGAPPRQPMYLPASEGGHAAVRFDGVDDALVIQSLQGPRGSFTALLAVKPAAPFGQGRMVGAAGGSDQFLFSSDRWGRIIAGTGRATRIKADDNPGSDMLVPGVWQLLTYVTDGESACLYRDGVLLARKPAGPAVPWDGLRLGCSQAEGALPEDVGEVVLYDRALPDDERRAVEQLLREEFGITPTPPIGP